MAERAAARTPAVAAKGEVCYPRCSDTGLRIKGGQRIMSGDAGMSGDAEVRPQPGVYGLDAEGRAVPVHVYQGGPYRLSDVVEIFDLGRVEGSADTGQAVLVLNARELRSLKTMADAFSFDYEEGFIEMCLEMTRFAEQLVGAPAGGEVRFTANF